MAAGGIHDQLGGGFHRYSTDANWLAPHFEKMLYDQAGLALAYANAYVVFGEERYAIVTRAILDYVMRDLGHPEGGYYAAEDADSEGEEGTFYVWTAGQIDSLLGPERGLAFRKEYQVSDIGNWKGRTSCISRHSRLNGSRPGARRGTSCSGIGPSAPGRTGMRKSWPDGTGS